MLCNPPSYDYHFGHCSHCVSKIDDLEQYLLHTFNEHAIEDLQYKQWLTVDRTNLEEILKSSDDFIQAFIDSLLKLRQHDYITKEQSSFFFSQKKSSLKEQEVLVTGDFSEKFSFIL